MLHSEMDRLLNSLLTAWSKRCRKELKQSYKVISHQNIKAVVASLISQRDKLSSLIKQKVSHHLIPKRKTRFIVYLIFLLRLHKHIGPNFLNFRRWADTYMLSS